MELLSNTIITDLNDDCLENIFERINDLPNQIQIAKTCKRFRQILIALWKRQETGKILNFTNLYTILTNEQDFIYFLQAMENEFHTLKLMDTRLNMFLRIMMNSGINCLSGVKRCEFSDVYSFVMYTSDDDIRSLTNLVPNIKYLWITVPVTGKHLTNFTKLEQLCLYDEETKVLEIEENNLRDILMQLKNLRILDIRNFEVSYLKLPSEIAECCKLEQLHCNLNSLMPVLGYVMQLPSLRLLRVMLDQDIDVSRIDNVDNFDFKIYETETYYDILRTSAGKLKGIAIDLHYLPLSEKCLLEDFSLINANKLKLLAICGCGFDLTRFLLNFPFSQLEILCLRHTENLDYDLILNIFKLNKNLQHLDLSYCKNLDKALLSSIMEVLKTENRYTTLNLYYRMSGFEAEIEKNYTFWSSQKYVQLRRDFPPNSDTGLSYVKRGFAFYY